jgi:hypothetical protein
MPIYENRQNAENIIQIPEDVNNEIITKSKEAIEKIADIILEQYNKSEASVFIAFDGWYGIDWSEIIYMIVKHLKGLNPEIWDINTLIYQNIDQINEYKKTFITEDPGFGYVNSEGVIDDIIDQNKLNALVDIIQKTKNESEKKAVVIYGSGTTTGKLMNCFDLVFYGDKTADPLLWKMWDGLLTPFGYKEPKKDYYWKEYYYTDFYMLNRHKNEVLKNMDYYIEAIEPGEIKLLSQRAYNTIIDEAVKYPIKQIKTYSPGPWGAYRYKDYWNIPGLECNAWNRLAGADLSLLIQVNEGKTITMPTTNLLKHDKYFIGKLMAKEIPGLIPLEVWLDDGYFPKPQPSERTSMPIHNHPSTDYVNRHFNEPLGRYETYYIVEAYEGANTWMGFKERADLELWEMKCRESEKTGKPIEDWKDFIANWETNVGDLFLIPPGTEHGHGGNQMVLEMDTCPSVCGAEYSFFGYDFCRPTWDDKTKTMTAKPMKMHLDHNFDNNQWHRESWVKENLRPRARIIKWTKNYWIDRFDSYASMPFEIERIHFNEFGEYTTDKKYLHAITLTQGENVVIQSVENPQYQTNIDFYQSSIIPAGLGAYKLINQKSGRCSVVIWRLKRG